ncbi:Mu-like prophage tail protein gpP [Faunimonas pinastri]|uniref:Mu-like prophage tail protein gpP n=1 Tax=Faunimonas pinastri TaxID=1855383 RepID=A0A1H9Q9P8_9HYPH|nr:hypothetical protein [Faunimonas pinastri]SER56875.1 Mu-like prophage tail protein gpP [Faunimonas pinastri]
MPKANEIAEIVVNGQRLRDWETVSVSAVYARSPARTFRFSVSETEANPSASTYTKSRVKPGDGCEIFLAGVRALTGFVDTRQVAFNERVHGIVLSGTSLDYDIVDCSAIAGSGQFRGYNFEQISKALLKPFGLQLKTYGLDANALKPFENFAIQTGETVAEALDRMARVRGITIGGDAGGAVVAMKQGFIQNDGDTLEEGKNILSGSCIINMQGLHNTLRGVTQRPGSDKAFGEDSRDVSATLKNTNVKRYRPLVFVAEHPGTREDIVERVNAEAAMEAGETIQVRVTVPGWLRSSGGLWDIGLQVKVKSDMMMIDADLTVCGVEFSQDQGGTTTTLDLVTQNALKGFGGPTGIVPDGEPFASATPNGKAKADAPDTQASSTGTTST